MIVLVDLYLYGIYDFLICIILLFQTCIKVEKCYIRRYICDISREI